nr:dTDP-3-amino-3,4,6-trideoxy-alpha-D-glucopyranose [Candidatus Anoxychlamydiales bacterium]
MENKINFSEELKNIQNCTWDRDLYDNYNHILAFYMAQSVMENTSKNSSLLDLACGDGTLLEMMSNHFSSIVGVDGSDKYLNLAKKKISTAKFYNSLIEDFNTDQKFDVVTLLCILEHVIDPISILKKAATFLKEDGIMIVHVPNALATNRVIAKIMGTLNNEYELSPFDINVAGHRRSYDISLLLTDIKNAKLKSISTGGIFYKMLSTPQFDWFLKNGLWDNGFGWGRTDINNKNWKNEFCRACYKYGQLKPNEC